jgi:hypothetical protein
MSLDWLGKEYGIWNKHFENKKLQHGFEAFLPPKTNQNIQKNVQLSNSKHDQFPKQFFTSNVV